MSEFRELLGEVLVKVEVAATNDTIIFTTASGRIFDMYHDQDCCERVAIEDICGSLEGLLGQPIQLAEEVENVDDPVPQDEDHFSGESYTWTFYKLATVNGYVTIRWLGQSNGYYSERVNFFERLKDDLNVC